MREMRIGDLSGKDFPLIVVPLIDKSLSSSINIDDADAIEMRVDMFDDLSEEYVVDTISKAKDNFNKPIILTIRSYSEGGAVQIDDKTRKKLFKALIKHVDAVDVEINSEIFGGIIKLARKNKKVSVGSFHDFTGTPSHEELSATIKKAKSFKADLVKIAVMPNSTQDLCTLTDITLKHADVGLITIAMGELGMASRVFFPMIGSLVTFATLDVETAPGQLSLSKIKEFLSVIKDNH
jgi:3-dehydroquinate dehydratase-1